MRYYKGYWFTINGESHRYGYKCNAGLCISEVAEDFVRFFVENQVEPCAPDGRIVVRVFKSEKGKKCHGLYTVFYYQGGLFCGAHLGEIEVAPF